MNVFNLIKSILEMAYYIVGIFGIIVILITIKNYREEQANKLIVAISESQKKFESLNELLKKELSKDKDGNTKFSDFCFISNIIQYLQGNGDLRNSTNFEKIKDTDIPEELTDSITSVFELFKDCILYLEKKDNEIDSSFKNLLEEYLANTIIPITKLNLNFDYRDEIKMIGKIIGATKVASKVTRSNRWQELYK